MLRFKHLLGLDTDDPYGDNPKIAQKGIRLPNVPDADEVAPAAAYNGLIYYDSTNNTFQGIANGAEITFSSTAGVGTLQQVTTAGKTSDVTAVEFTGASSAANGILIGDGTRKLQLYTDGTDSFIATASGDLKLVPTGSDVRVTGNVVASGLVSSATIQSSGLATLASCTVTGAFSAGSFAVDALASSTAGSTLTLDGQGAGGVNICSVSTGGITLSDDVGVAAGKVLTVTGAGGSNEFVITAGDAVMSDGSLSITDADNAASIVLTNDSYTNSAAGLVDINAGGVVTGTLINVKADALTSGTMVYLETSAVGMVGKYIQCYDGAADDFSVGLYGATIIAGNAAGTAALTVSAGDLKLTAGVIDQDIVTDHSNVFTRAQATTTGDFFQILCTDASDDHAALYVSHSGTAAIPAVEIVSAGSDSALVVSSTAAAGSALTVSCAADATDSIAKVDGASNDWIGADDVGLVNIACDGALAHADASCLRIAYSGGGAASGMGTSLRIVDTGSTASSIAAYLSAATGEALKVDAGKAYFDEGVIVGDGGVGYVSSNGAQDLVLRTNEGTNSGTITITDGASGNITIDCDTDGRVAIPGAALHGSNTQFFVPFVIRKAFSHADPDGNNDIILCNANSPKLCVIDAWVDMTTAEGGAMTITLRDAAAGAGNAISNAIDANVTTISRATTLSTVALAANSSIVANFSGNPGTAVGTIYVSCIEVA